jgi:hypothetical protein
MTNSSKIFCIGLSRTGTTSISQALSVLGYTGCHYPDDDDVVSKSFKGNFNWDIFKTCDFVSDIPVALFYKELDRTWSNSKFILTIRDQIPWLNSCRKKIKSNTIVDPVKLKGVFSIAVRAAVYGKPFYDEQSYISAYQRHIDSVLEYFDHRKSDLLIMDVKEGWNPLCDFLGKDIPELDFPHLTKSRKNIYG